MALRRQCNAPISRSGARQARAPLILKISGVGMRALIAKFPRHVRSGAWAVNVHPAPSAFGGVFFGVSFFVLNVCAALLLCSPSQAANRPQSWRIDEAQTSIAFKIDAVGFPTTHGHFGHYSGKILIDLDRPAKSFTNFTVDATSVEVGAASFNDFVKSAALLNVQRFPTMAFASTQVEKLDSHTARVIGNLTMLGVSRPITLTVNVEPNAANQANAVSFVAKGTIVRSEFGMTFGIPLVDDAIEITVKTRALNDE
jgi:polyisoprenoid-binding protein YceI